MQTTVQASRRGRRDGRPARCGRRASPAGDSSRPAARRARRGCGRRRERAQWHGHQRRVVERRQRDHAHARRRPGTGANDAASRGRRPATPSTSRARGCPRAGRRRRADRAEIDGARRRGRRGGRGSAGGAPDPAGEAGRDDERACHGDERSGQAATRRAAGARVASAVIGGRAHQPLESKVGAGAAGGAGAAAPRAGAAAAARAPRWRPASTAGPGSARRLGWRRARARARAPGRPAPRRVRSRMAGQRRRRARERRRGVARGDRQVAAEPARSRRAPRARGRVVAVGPGGVADRGGGDAISATTPSARGRGRQPVRAGRAAGGRQTPGTATGFLAPGIRQRSRRSAPCRGGSRSSCACRSARLGDADDEPRARRAARAGSGRCA